MAKENIERQGRIDKLPIYPLENIISLCLSGNKIERFERIPFEKIDYDPGIVEEGHVRELAEQMKNSRGQLSPILVRVIPNSEKKDVFYEIADGFHRTGAFPYVPIIFPDAKVIYNCSDEEFYETRIVAANNIPCVKFSRMGKWVEEAYSKSKWAQKGINLSTILSIAATDSSGARLNLEPEEIEEIKEYCNEKAKIWKLSLASFAVQVNTIENSNPQLINRVRELKGGTAGKKYLNVARLQAITTNLKDKDKQVVASDISTSHNMNKLQTAIVSKALNYIDSSNKENLAMLQMSPIEVAKDILVNEGVDSSELITNTYKAIIHKSVGKYGSKNDGDIQKENKLLKEENEILKKDKTKSTLESSAWWLVLENLSIQERLVMLKVFSELKDFDEVGSEMGLTNNQIIQLIKSVHKKYQIEEQTLKIDAAFDKFKNNN
jgi:DNA-directed RNA polymerase specialized sigma subunit